MAAVTLRTPADVEALALGRRLQRDPLYVDRRAALSKTDYDEAQAAFVTESDVGWGASWWAIGLGLLFAAVAIVALVLAGIAYQRSNNNSNLLVVPDPGNGGQLRVVNGPPGSAAQMNAQMNAMARANATSSFDNNLVVNESDGFETLDAHGCGSWDAQSKTGMMTITGTMQTCTVRRGQETCSARVVVPHRGWSGGNTAFKVDKTVYIGQRTQTGSSAMLAKENFEVHVEQSDGSSVLKFNVDASDADICRETGEACVTRYQVIVNLVGMNASERGSLEYVERGASGQSNGSSASSASRGQRAQSNGSSASNAPSIANRSGNGSSVGSSIGRLAASSSGSSVSPQLAPSSSASSIGPLAASSSGSTIGRRVASSAASSISPQLAPSSRASSVSALAAPSSRSSGKSSSTSPSERLYRPAQQPYCPPEGPVFVGQRVVPQPGYEDSCSDRISSSGSSASSCRSSSLGSAGNFGSSGSSSCSSSPENFYQDDEPSSSSSCSSTSSSDENC